MSQLFSLSAEQLERIKPGAAIVLVWLCALPRPWSIANPCWMSFRPGACGQRRTIPPGSASCCRLPPPGDKHFLINLAPVPAAHNGASWPHSPPWQRRRSLIFAIQQTGFFQNAQHKDKQLVVYLQRQAPPDAAQGGVSGHGFTGGKAQEFPQGQGIANCAGRCRAQSRCPETAYHEHAERAARRDGPAARFFGGEGSTELFGEGVKFFHAGAVAAAGTRPAPDSGAVDRTKATGSSAVPASSQDAWPPPLRQRLLAWAPLCPAWRLFNRLVQQQRAHRQSR